MEPGIIAIEDLRIRCIIGDMDFERKLLQEISLDVVCCLDFKECGASDCLKDTVDYVVLSQILTHNIQSKKYHLLETLVYNEVTHIIKEHERILKLSIKATKTGCITNAQKTYAMYEKEREISRNS